MVGMVDDNYTPVRATPARQMSVSREQVMAAVMLTWWECRQRYNTVDVHEAALARTHFLWPTGMPDGWIASLEHPDGFRDAQQNPDIQQLVDDLHRDLNQGTYQPSPLLSQLTAGLMVKSPSLSARSIVIRTLRDSIVFNIALLACYDTIYQRFESSVGQSYRCWQVFAPDVLFDIERLSQIPVNALIQANFSPLDRSLVSPDQTLIELDLFRAYQMSDMGILTEHLTRWGCPAEAVDLISTMCRAYSLNGKMGLPTSSLASMVLFDVLLYPIDEQLTQWGWVFNRHLTDTYEMVVPESMALSRAAEQLYGLFARQGLYINDDKTQIRFGQGHTATVSAGWLYRQVFGVIQSLNHAVMWPKAEAAVFLFSYLPGTKRLYQNFLRDWLTYDPYQALPRVISRLQRSPRFWLTLQPVLEQYMTSPDMMLEMGKLTTWTCMTRINHQWQKHPSRATQSVAKLLADWLTRHTDKGGPV